MMLRKRCRASRRDQSAEQLMPESAPAPRSFSPDAVRKPGSPSFFGPPGLPAGLAKGVADSESSWSPRSPLDFRAFSGLGGHLVWSPLSPGADGPRKSWDCDRVGLGLIDSLNDGDKCRGGVLGSSESRSILLGSQLRINIPCPKTHLDRLLAEGSATSPKSLPKNYVISSHTRVGSPKLQLGSSEMGLRIPGAQLEPRMLGRIQFFSSDMVTSSALGSEVLHLESKNARLVSPPYVGGAKLGTSSASLPITRGFPASISASEIEQSEDYTCITSHGPNPKTTRIFGDHILESHTSDLPDSSGHERGKEGRVSFWMANCSEGTVASPADDFLRVCFSCKKNLEGKDIFMYRGEMAFCSSSCRSQEILVEEEMEEPVIDSSDPTKTSCHEEFFLPIVAVST